MELRVWSLKVVHVLDSHAGFVEQGVIQIMTRAVSRDVPVAAERQNDIQDPATARAWDT